MRSERNKCEPSERNTCERSERSTCERSERNKWNARPLISPAQLAREKKSDACATHGRSRNKWNARAANERSRNKWNARPLIIDTFARSSCPPAASARSFAPVFSALVLPAPLAQP